MPRRSIKATELVNPDVTHVAMVKRGANRLPFRIMKEDHEMSIDLSAIGARLFKSEKAPVQPNIVGVALAKGADTAALIAAFAAAGEDISAFVKTESEDSVTLTKSDSKATEDTILVVKMDADTAVMIEAPSDMVKAVNSYDWESTSFNEVLQKGTFIPSVGMAQEMLQRTFSNILEKAEDSKSLAKMMKSAVGEFEDYITQLAKGVPASLFKADLELAKSAKTKKKPEEETEEAKDDVKKEEVSTSPTHGDETTKTKPTGDDHNIEGSPAHGNETPKNPAQKPSIGTSASSNDIEGSPVADSATSSVKKSDEDPTAAFAELLKAAMGDLKTSLSQEISTLKTDLSGVSERVSGLDARVQKTDAALSGTVIGEPGDDKPARVQKSESEAYPLLDTAYTNAA